MRKILFLILMFGLCVAVSYGAAPSRVSTYLTGTTIESSDVSGNEDAIFLYLQQGVDTYADGSIIDADINSAAAIAASKLDLDPVTQDINHTGTLTQSGTITSTGTAAFTSASFTTITDLGNVTTTGTIGLDGKLTAGATEIEGSAFDINGGTVDAITSLTVANAVDIGPWGLRASTLTADALTATRVPFASTNGLLVDDSDMTFATDTLTVTKYIFGTSISDGTTAITEWSLDDTMGGDSDTAIPTEKSVKAYADGAAGHRLIDATTFTSEGAQAVTIVADRHYLIQFYFVVDTSDIDLDMRINNTSGSGYISTIWSTVLGGTTETAANGGTADFTLAGTSIDTSGEVYGKFYLSTYDNAAIKAHLEGEVTYENQSNTYTSTRISGVYTTSAPTSFEIVPTAANLTGTVYTYEYDLTP